MPYLARPNPNAEAPSLTAKPAPLITPHSALLERRLSAAREKLPSSLI
jgi:hypothetical protein